MHAAFHEAGHAVAVLALGYKLVNVDMHRAMVGIRRARWLPYEVIFTLAGAAAEGLAMHCSPLWILYDGWGTSDRGFVERMLANQWDPSDPGEVARMVREELREFLAMAVECLERHWPAVEVVAHQLHAEEFLEGTRVTELAVAAAPALMEDRRTARSFRYRQAVYHRNVKRRAAS
jgi:hypothetical protein